MMPSFENKRTHHDFLAVEAYALPVKRSIWLEFMGIGTLRAENRKLRNSVIKLIDVECTK